MAKENKLDPLNKADYYSRTFPFKLEAGKTYMIDMKAASFVPAIHPPPW